MTFCTAVYDPCQKFSGAFLQIEGKWDEEKKMVLQSNLASKSYGIGFHAMPLTVDEVKIRYLKRMWRIFHPTVLSLKYAMKTKHSTSWDMYMRTSLTYEKQFNPQKTSSLIDSYNLYVVRTLAAFVSIDTSSSSALIRSSLLLSDYRFVFQLRPTSLCSLH